MHFRKHFILYAIILLMIGFSLTACLGNESDQDENSDDSSNSIRGILSSTEDIGLYDVDGNGWNYAFTYDGEEYSAQYTYESWKVYDSYKIINKNDIRIICQALIDVHPVYGSDYTSYRTAKDMAYEWRQHNLAYRLIPEDSGWKWDVKDVDLDPQDQGKSLKELYEDRTGRALKLTDILERML